jgi:hypothetical protein
MLAQSPRDRIIDMAGNVVAAFRRRQPDGLKAGDFDIGRL